MEKNIFVTTIDLQLADKLLKGLIAQGCTITHPAYTLFSGKKTGLSCTLYQSGKLSVQGKEIAPFIEFFLEPEILGKYDYTYPTEQLDITGRIGIDESGKGDFFGPLCVAGVFAEGEGIKALQKMGVCDSKKLSDAAIIKLGNQIRSQFVYQLIKINPPKYNQLYAQFLNLNRLLAWGHATAIEELVAKTACRCAIIDQFADEHVVLTALKRKSLVVELTQRHRGEEDLIVAAASIIARQGFLEGLAALEKQWEVKLPKGASAQTIEAARQFVQKHGEAALPQVAKTHFKTAKAL